VAQAYLQGKADGLRQAGGLRLVAGLAGPATSVTIARVRIAFFAVVLTLLCTALGAAAPLGAGMRMPALALTDQHDVQGAVGPATRCVLFTRDMDATKVLNEALGDNPAALIAAAHAVVISDISGMPSLITKLFALPKMRKRPYQILLDRDGKATADFPFVKGKVTVFHLHALTIESIQHLDSAGALRTLLRHAAETTPAAAPAGTDRT